MEETNLMDGDNFAPTGTSEANFSTHCVSTLTISDEEADKASTEGDSDDPVAEKDILPGIAFFSPESIFEDDFSPIVVISYNGVQHVFLDTNTASGQADDSNLRASQLAAFVPEFILTSGPTRVHHLHPSVFFGPLSTFMRMLQRQFGIDRDVTLEFDSISLSVPINMSFASTSLSLAHIYAIATASASESKNEPVRSNISRMGQDSQLSASSDGSQILIASLVVESTNFVKKYNELVQNFQSKRSLNLTQSSQTVPVSHSESQNRKPTRRSSTSRARQMSESTGSDSMILDEVSSVESAKSTESVASSTWSRLAVRDTGSVAVLSDNESVYEDWDRTRQASTLFARSHRDFFLHDSSIPWIRSSEALSSTSLDPRDTPLFSSSPASSSPPTGNSPASNNRPNRFHFATSGTPSPNSVSKKRPRMNASSSLHSVPNMPYSVHNYEEGQISSKRPKYQSVPARDLENIAQTEYPGQVPRMTIHLHYPLAFQKSDTPQGLPSDQNLIQTMATNVFTY